MRASRSTSTARAITASTTAARPVAGRPTTVVTGWGRTAGSAATLVRPTADRDVVEVVRGAVQQAAGGGLITRGMGRSYGDAALCHDGTVLELTGRNRILEFDPDTGVLVAEAGATIAQILALTHRLGWIPPVMPGTAHVTLGGAVAADVHGKNHVSSGSFGAHVQWLDLLRADLEVSRLSPHHRSHEFWATVGGMGLTGVILVVSLQLRRAGGSVLRHQQRGHTVRDVLRLLDGAAQTQWENSDVYAVAWVDGAATGGSAGRGLVETARLLADGDSARPARAEPGLTLPSLPGSGLINTRTIRAANALRWNRSRDSRWMVGSLSSALHPLDRAELWPAAFGRAGLIQCQIAVPDEAESILPQVLSMLRSLRVPPALVTMKRFGTASPAPLSFPLPGWTMAMDFPARWLDLRAALDRVHSLVAASGGRAYLTKDSRLSATTFAAMYPRLEQWQAIRDTMDPERVFTSDLGRRLGMVAAGGAR